MTRKNQFNYLLILLAIIVVVSVILGLFGLLWWYFVIGALLSIVLHFLMVLQNERFYRIQLDRFQKEYFAPKKDTIIWYVLRWFIVAFVFALVILLAKLYYEERLLEASLLFLIPLILVKISFIIVIYLQERRWWCGF